jgi:hypothetical protein
VGNIGVVNIGFEVRRLRPHVLVAKASYTGSLRPYIIGVGNIGVVNIGFEVRRLRPHILVA